MKLPIAEEKEVRQVYDTWLKSYLNGDIKVYDSYLDPEYRFIGSTDNEEFLNKKDTTNFLKVTADQLAGKAEVRNSVKTVEKLGDLVFITEVFDAYFLNDAEWAYYGRFRFTSALRKKENGWRFVYQHFSMPDAKAQEGETLGTEQISKENQELRDAIKRRTVELEQKNRELEIEASLERVRARSLAMQSSDELLDASDTMFAELEKLSIDALRIGICTIDGKTGAAEIWSRSENKKSKESKILGVVPKGTHPVFDDMFKAWKAQKASFSNTRKGLAVKAYYEKVSEYLSYPLPKKYNKEESITAFFFPEGSLNVVSLHPLGKKDHEIMLRFAKVFGQIYQRFLDLQKAEAQAREAQIEAALERVRSRSMGMQKSEELFEVGAVLYRELCRLGVENLTTGYVLFDEKARIGYSHGVNPADGSIRQIATGMPHDETPVMKSIVKSWKKREPLLIIELNEDETIKHQTFIAERSTNFPLTAEKLIAISPKRLKIHTLNFKQGYLLIVGGTLLSKEQQGMAVRFAKVFEQVYTRFLDLQKAESQAREAHIEAALEKVRSRSMAMHKSEELKEVIQVVYEQFIQLNIHIEHTGIILDYKNREDMLIWLADAHDIPTPQVSIPYFDSPHWNSFREAKATGGNFFANLLDFDTKNKFYRELFDHIPGIPEESKEFYLTCPALAGSTVLLDNVGLYIENFEGIPYTEEENEILMRFGKVFQQAYTRFLDLQKAEAQAREAQIENALEKVRSRTMAMQKGDEVKDVVVHLYKELMALGVDNFVTCGYVEINEKINRQYTWVTSPGGDSLGLFYLPLTGDATFDERYTAWKKQQIIFHQTVAGEVRSKHLEFAITTFNSKEAEEMVRSQFPDPCVFYCFNFSHGYLHLVTGSRLKEEEESLLARFTRVFEQTYARFLDLKKAEAQAREAQIENALEKVRSRTMAMQHSNELPEAANVLFLEVQNLGIPAWSCGYNILSTDKKSSVCIMSSEGELQEP
ncbi:MAG: nuclear transport factor 2 family protein, partial [Flavobacteriaceae bacterium]